MCILVVLSALAFKQSSHDLIVEYTLALRSILWLSPCNAGPMGPSQALVNTDRPSDNPVTIQPMGAYLPWGYIHASSSPIWPHASPSDSMPLASLQECHGLEWLLVAMVARIYGTALASASTPVILSSPCQSHRCYSIPRRVLFVLLSFHSDWTLCSSYEPGAGACFHQPWSGPPHPAYQSLGG